AVTSATAESHELLSMECGPMCSSRSPRHRAPAVGGTPIRKHGNRRAHGGGGHDARQVAAGQRSHLAVRSRRRPAEPKEEIDRIPDMVSACCKGKEMNMIGLTKKFGVRTRASYGVPFSKPNFLFRKMDN